MPVILSPCCQLFSLIQDPATLKEEGNTLFKAGDMQGAVCCYTKALKLSDKQAESHRQTNCWSA